MICSEVKQTYGLIFEYMFSELFAPLLDFMEQVQRHLINTILIYIN